MSVFGVGQQTTGEGNPVAGKPTNETVPETLIKWIPADVLALYAGILAIGARQGPLSGMENQDEILARIEPGHLCWFLFALLITPFLVFLGAKYTNKQPGGIHLWPLVVRALLAMAAFTLWTSLLPGSWTYGLDWIRDMGAAFPLVMAVIVALFAGGAEMLLSKVENVRGAKKSLGELKLGSSNAHGGPEHKAAAPAAAV